jgi:hypothetical protein
VWRAGRKIHCFDTQQRKNAAGWAAHNPSGNGRIYTLTYWRFDKAGNKSDCILNVSVPVDKTAPTITAAASPAPNAAGWNNTPVRVIFTCTDIPAESGIESCTPPVTLTSEGEDQHVDGRAEDQAGNIATTVKHINIDMTPPKVTCSATPNVLQPADGRLVPVNVTVDVSDELSGSAGFTLVSVESNDDGGASGIQGFRVGTPDTDGTLRASHSPHTAAAYTLTYRGMDKAGNTATCSAIVSVPNDQNDSLTGANTHSAIVSSAGVPGGQREALADVNTCGRAATARMATHR